MVLGEAMKAFLLSMVGCVVAGVTAPVIAADVPSRTYDTKVPPLAGGIYEWGGFYLGANAGYGSSHKCWDLVALSNAPITQLREGCHDATGGVGGGQFGYRWQRGALVLGLEAQIDFADLDGASTSAATLVTGNRSRIDSFGLFTGQVGYAWKTALLYARGGAAVTGDRYSDFSVATGAPLSLTKETRWGSVAGIGLEFGFASNWSVAVEYDHLFMGTRNVDFVFAGAPLAVTDRIRQDADILTVRANYRWEGPVAVKY